MFSKTLYAVTRTNLLRAMDYIKTLYAFTYSIYEKFHENEGMS